MSNPYRPELAFLAQPEFIRGRLLPALPPALRALADQVEVKQVDTEDPEKLTAAYTLSGGTRIYAKVYKEEASGQHCATVMRQLRENGFGDDARYRVPEPLAFLAQERLLVMAEAPGVNLNDSLGTESAIQFDGMREAARWLAQLHAAPVRVGTPAPYWEHFFKISRRVAKALEQRPAWAARLVDMLDRLEPLAEQAGSNAPVVQTHGQFRDLHLYLTPNSVTAIDFDRSRPADPAADLEEFVHRLRWKTFKHYGSRPDALTATFLEEYARIAPDRNLRNLSYYAAYRTLYSLIGLLRSRNDMTWEEEVAFHLDDFDASVQGRLLPQS